MPNFKTKKMKDYEVLVWYRYVIDGEQEKDCENFNVKAESEEDAISKIKLQYAYKRNAIPFKFEILNN